jgi:phage tail-like protein
MRFGVNAVFAAATSALGVRLDPYLGCNFLVEIEGMLAGGFREVRGLESSLELREYAEGGVNGFLHKLPGPVRYPNLVLSRGLIDLETLWVWYDEVSRGLIQRRNITLMLLDGRRMPVMWWDIRRALPVKWSGPTFNAGSDAEVATESIELVHEGIVKPDASRIVTAARAAAGPLATAAPLPTPASLLK